MTRHYIADVRNEKWDTGSLRLPVYVRKISRLCCTKEGKYYFYVSVTDGRETMDAVIFDGRINHAKERFEGMPAYITLKRSKNEEIYISRIEECEDFSANDFGNITEATENPERLKLKSVDMGKEYHVCLPLLVTEVSEERTSKSGKPYYTVTGSDGTDSVKLYVWENGAEHAKEEMQGHVLYITLQTGSYPKLIQHMVCGDYPVSEFIERAPVSSDEMYAYVTAALEEASEKCSVAKVALKIYEDRKQEILKSAGAMKLHHSVYGGLLFHTYRMLQSAKAFSRVYLGLDAELLYTGVCVHDIGKLNELTTDEIGHTEFTVDGTLGGHILLGIEIIDETVWEMDEKPDKEELRLLKHMVASHHGVLEHGSPVVPATPEAMALHCLDLLDSRMDMYENTMSGMDPGSISGSVYALGGAHVYKRTEK